MAGDGVVEVLVKDDVSASVAPAAHVHRNPDSRGVTGSVLDVDAHYRVLASHALGADADGVDAVLKELAGEIYSPDDVDTRIAGMSDTELRRMLRKFAADDMELGMKILAWE